MAQPSIASLPKPKLVFRIDYALNAIDHPKCHFETPDQARIQDAKRATSVRRYPLHRQVVADELAAYLDRKRSARRARRRLLSASSMVDMRGLRIRIAGNLQELTSSRPRDGAKCVHLVKTTWFYRPEDLWQLDPAVLTRQLRQDLNRAMAAIRTTGGPVAADEPSWGIFCLHGEYDPTHRRFNLHFHGVAAGALLQACRALKKQRGYKGDHRHPTDRARIRNPVRIRAIKNAPRQLVYNFFSFWPARARGESGEGGGSGGVASTRGRTKRRIPEPHHGHLMQWLDRWTPQHFVVLVGMRASATGFIVRNA